MGIAQAGGGSESETPLPLRPDWVNEDGSIDMTKVPEKLPLLDRNGDVCGYISRDELFAAPDEMPVTRQSDQSDLSREIVVNEDGSTTEIVEAPPAEPLGEHHAYGGNARTRSEWSLI